MTRAEKAALVKRHHHPRGRGFDYIPPGNALCKHYNKPKTKQEDVALVVHVPTVDPMFDAFGGY